MGRYPAPGNVARLTCVFTDEDAITYADPTTTTVIIKAPNADPATFTPIKDDIGEYHYDLTLDSPGTYRARFKGTGAVIAQTPDLEIVVDQPSF